MSSFCRSTFGRIFFVLAAAIINRSCYSCHQRRHNQYHPQQQQHQDDDDHRSRILFTTMPSHHGGSRSSGSWWLLFRGCADATTTAAFVPQRPPAHYRHRRRIKRTSSRHNQQQQRRPLPPPQPQQHPNPHHHRQSQHQTTLFGEDYSSSVGGSEEYFQQHQQLQPQRVIIDDDNDEHYYVVVDDGEEDSSAIIGGRRRRHLLRGIVKAAAAAALTLTTTSSGVVVSPAWAAAADPTTTNNSGEGGGGSSSLSSSREQVVAEFLHDIPTFVIVDTDNGAPFMVVGEDAKVTGYFFTNYNEANRILQLAKTSAETSIRETKREQQRSNDDDEELKNPWKMARIGTVPLDTAVALSLRSGGRDFGYNHFQVAASQSDIDDALVVTGRDDLPEGKVPLFYYEDFEIGNESSKKSPLYFERSQLEAVYRKQQSGNNKTNKELLPETKVTELFAVLTEMAKKSEPGGGSVDSDDDLDKLVLVSPVDSDKYAQRLLKKPGQTQFLLGQRNVVL